MPVRNEANFIARSLGRVLSQDYPEDRLEVIVADGMSTDGTREIVRSLQAGRPNLRLIDNPGRIVPTGLNAAISQAKGEVIVRVDGHCEIEQDYVRRCVEHLSRGGVDCVGGPLETVGDTFVARGIAAAMSSPFGVGGSAFRTTRGKTMLADTVPFPSFTRAIIERAGPFDEELVRNQDDEYSYRLRRMGAKILLAADVRSRYYSRNSLSSLGRQYFQYGLWKVRVMQKHGRQMQVRQFIPLAFVVALLGSLIVAPFHPAGGWGFVSVSACYLVAAAAASLLTARKAGWALLPLLPATFATLHLSYGAGFLVGLIKHWNRWGDRETNWGQGRPQVPGVKQV